MTTDHGKRVLLLVHAGPHASTVGFFLPFTTYLSTWYNEVFEGHLCMFSLLLHYITMTLSMAFSLEK